MKIRSVYFPVLLALLVTCVGAVLVYIATQAGIGITPDSTVYLQGARSLASGNGFAHHNGTPITHYPPLYPALLASSNYFNVDPIDYARPINIFLFSLTVLTAFIIGVNREKHSFSFALCVSILAAFSTAQLNFHRYLLTEPLYVLSTLFGLYLLAVYLENRKLHLLLLCAVATSLACLTKYVGVVNVAVGIVAISAWLQTTPSARIRSILIFASISSTPLLLWFIRNAIVAGNPANRSTSWHPIGSDQFFSLFHTIGTWFVPDDISITLRAILGAVILAAILLFGLFSLFGSRKSENEKFVSTNDGSIARVFSLYIVGYVAFVSVSISLFDSATFLGERILLPVHVPVIFLVVTTFFYFIEKHARLYGALAVVFLGIFVTFTAARGARWTYYMRNDAGGYAGMAWKHSQTLSYIDTISDRTLIYTNAPDVLLLLKGRSSRQLPLKYDPTSLNDNPDFYLETKALETNIGKGAVLVFFNRITFRPFLPTLEEVKNLLPDQNIEYFNDGVIIGLKD